MASGSVAGSRHRLEPGRSFACEETVDDGDKPVSDRDDGTSGPLGRAAWRNRSAERAHVGRECGIQPVALDTLVVVDRPERIRRGASTAIIATGAAAGICR
jgi:hypothetical protein